MVELAIEHPVTAADCFHCGLPVPFGVRYVAKIDGAERPMCCPGCCAVAQAITDAGLADYYRYRTAAAVPQLRQHDAPVAAELQLFDLAEVQQTFVRATDDCVKEAALILENITCAACVWLIEKRRACLCAAWKSTMPRSARALPGTRRTFAFLQSCRRLPTSVTARNRTTLCVPTRSIAPNVGRPVAPVCRRLRIDAGDDGRVHGVFRRWRHDARYRDVDALGEPGFDHARRVLLGWSFFKTPGVI